jgi:aminoglycoside phosphotransferase (APT) family kinase protein
VSRTHATRREFAGRIVAEMARTAAQRWRPGAVPRTPTDITAEWLSELMGRRVDAIAVCDEEHGTATRARLALTGDGVPATVFVKTTPTRPIERLFNNVYGLGEAEAVFYQVVAREIADCTPNVYGARWDSRTGRSVVVIEDLAARGTRFADASVSCTAEEAATMARTLAGLHRKYWESPRFGTDLSRFSPAGSPVQWFGTYSSALLARVPHRYDDVIDDGFRRDALLLHTRREEVARIWRSLPQSLLHGDTHRGNLGFHDNGLTLFDWQVTGQGPALKDLAYFAATSLDPDLRRSIERDLVRDYVDTVTVGGGPDITEAAAWDQYRLLVVTGYIAAAFTAVFAERLQSDGTMRPALARAVAAVRDHDAFGRLRRQFT